MSKLRRHFERKLGVKQDALPVYPGTLGNGVGVVDAGSGRVYVRIAGSVETAVCESAPHINDLPVWVGYSPAQPDVLRVLSQRVTGAAATVQGGMSKHAASHEWLGGGPQGGTDVLRVHIQQIMPLRVMPYIGLTVMVYPGLAWTGSAWILVADTNIYNKPIPKTIDFLDYSMPESGKAFFALVTLGSSGDLVVTVGAQVAIAELTLTDIPDAPVDTRYVLAAVRRFDGQYEVVENRETTDIIDLRFPMRHEHDGAYEASQVITDTEKIQIISNEIKLRGDLDIDAGIKFNEITAADGDKRIGYINSDWGGAAEHDGMLWLVAKREADSPWDAAGITLNASDTETGKYARIWLRSDGQIKIYGPVNVLDGIIWGGWQPDSDVWKYVSATQFKIEGKNVASRFPAGTKIKLTQSSLKYFYATSASYSDGNTIVTVTGGSDYSLANATIKSPHYSYASTPQGFPQWFNYTPTIIAGFSSPPTLSNCYFCITGRLCYYRFHCSNTGTSNSNLFQVSAPVNAGGEYNGTTCYAVDNGVAQTSPGLLTIFSGYNTVTIYKNLAAAGWTASGEKRATFVIAYPVG